MLTYHNVNNTTEMLQVLVCNIKRTIVNKNSDTMLTYHNVNNTTEMLQVLVCNIKRTIVNKNSDTMLESYCQDAKEAMISFVTSRD